MVSDKVPRICQDTKTNHILNILVVRKVSFFQFQDLLIGWAYAPSMCGCIFGIPLHSSILTSLSHSCCIANRAIIRLFIKIKLFCVILRISIIFLSCRIVYSQIIYVIVQQKIVKFNVWVPCTNRYTYYPCLIFDFLQHTSVVQSVDLLLSLMCLILS